VGRETRQFGIEELAERGGVTRRTVRYYVQRGLLPPPTGVGRGDHYTEAHLAALVRVRELQEAGVSLADIPAHLAQSLPEAPRVIPRESAPSQATWTRIALGADLELHVRGRRLSEEQMSALMTAITEVIGEDGR
jgi:DNA-binding transcriptional MerR regulator